jgi:hypothetical protein
MNRDASDLKVIERGERFDPVTDDASIRFTAKNVRRMAKSARKLMEREAPLTRWQARRLARLVKAIQGDIAFIRNLEWR